jgi:hypothetical protein
MDKFDRIVQLHAILRNRRTAISFEDLRARLERGHQGTTPENQELHFRGAHRRERDDPPRLT